ncbi:ADP-forming succinate--CoA ligase subunit beta [Simkania negevensis]|uniref:Succinate--CoA ligase [ADP-forming] subunit beta n=1 Tax=Simkania negevensis TaxID=83561 RepID=A0ABS3AV40_9BACT|nr:ADP-forming succinate--CoA ligase subunit beta [Simkania negevensis]
MHLHEYQAKKLLQKYRVPIPPFGVAASAEEAVRIAERLSLEEVVLKVQVHAGGRGKAGGVKFAKNLDEVKQKAEELIGLKIVNQQTGPQGIIAHQILVSAAKEIKKEYYVGMIIDRNSAIPTLLISPEGGMDIEEIAATKPDKLLSLPVAFDGTLRPYQQRVIASFMGWRGETAKQGVATVSGLAKAFIDSDASLLEINPLIETADGDIFAIDAKLTIDDNALFRQQELAHCYDPSQQLQQEVDAKEADLAYIGLDGNIGCLVNGAGLAMATMDIIQFYGATPANFLDVGGSASKEKVARGFKIILRDPKVKGILVNIFGGILDCTTLAEGVIAAAEELQVCVPLVVRMEGTNVERGRELLRASPLNIITATTMGQAAETIVNAIKGA